MSKIAKKAAKKVPRRPPARTRATLLKDAEWSPATLEPIVLGEAAPAFQKDAAKRMKLMAILRDPVFREAMAILEDEIRPRGDLAIFLKKPEVAAARFHQQAGLIYLTDGFRRLTKEPQVHKVPQGKSLTKELPKE